MILVPPTENKLCQSYLDSTYIEMDNIHFHIGFDYRCRINFRPVDVSISRSLGSGLVYAINSFPFQCER